VAILLFQDLCVVPLMVLMPMLAGTEQGPTAVLRAVGVTIAVKGGLILAGGLCRASPASPRCATEIFTLCAYITGAAFSPAIRLRWRSARSGGLGLSGRNTLQTLDISPFHDVQRIFFTSIRMR
jgi:Kef-type K+ transport system membrane component KefB